MVCYFSGVVFGCMVWLVCVVVMICVVTGWCLLV